MRVHSLGGATRNRTGDEGFADPCLTAWPWRRGKLLLYYTKGMAVCQGVFAGFQKNIQEAARMCRSGRNVLRRVFTGGTEKSLRKTTHGGGEMPDAAAGGGNPAGRQARVLSDPGKKRHQNYNGTKERSTEKSCGGDPHPQNADAEIQCGEKHGKRGEKPSGNRGNNHQECKQDGSRRQANGVAAFCAAPGGAAAICLNAAQFRPENQRKNSAEQHEYQKDQREREKHLVFCLHSRILLFASSAFSIAGAGGFVKFIRICKI